MDALRKKILALKISDAALGQAVEDTLFQLMPEGGMRLETLGSEDWHVAYALARAEPYSSPDGLRLLKKAETWIRTFLYRPDSLPDISLPMALSLPEDSPRTEIERAYRNKLGALTTEEAASQGTDRARTRDGIDNLMSLHEDYESAHFDVDAAYKEFFGDRPGPK
ncbi:MAG: hypothetical protein HY074_16970 [Deltaproteobacteria bacterium]|nr:hypothetical protein [Deltaproteobacteria bacterium]